MLVIRNFLIAIFVIVLPVCVPAQNATPAYVAEMPSVDQVMKAMQAGDPDETAARQMGALMQLKTMIEDLAGPRYYKPGLTPEEAKLRQAYYTAYYQISQSKPEYRSFVAMKGYDISPKFRDELIQKCFPPAFAAEYPKLVAQAKSQNQELHARAEQNRNKQAAIEQQAQAQKAAPQIQSPTRFTAATSRARTTTTISPSAPSSRPATSPCSLQARRFPAAEPLDRSRPLRQIPVEARANRAVAGRFPLPPRR